MADREKVIAGLTMLADRKNDDTCEGLKCCKIAEDALALLKEQETTFICNLFGGEPCEVYCKECKNIVCQLFNGETMDDMKIIFSYCQHCGRKVKWDA